MEREKRSERRKLGGLPLQAALAAVCILIGSLLFVPEIDVRVLCTAFCVLLIVAGIACIARFFITGAYRSLREYSFSAGVLLLILGGCGLARTEALSASFVTCTGLLVLLSGILMIQCTVQLSVLRSGWNILIFIFALASLFGAVTVMMDFRPILSAAEVFPQAALLLSGVFSLVSLCVTALALRRSRKQREAERQQAPAEAENSPAPDFPEEGEAPVPAEPAEALPEER